MFLKITRKQAEAMPDRELLAKYLTKISAGFREHWGQVLMLRDGRWGTCSSCPRDALNVNPKNCEFSDRYDHNIHSTKDGKFYEYGNEIPKSELINAIIS